MFTDVHVERLVVDESGSGTGIYRIHADLTPAEVRVERLCSRVTIVRRDGSTYDVALPSDRR